MATCRFINNVIKHQRASLPRLRKIMYNSFTTHNNINPKEKPSTTIVDKYPGVSTEDELNRRGMNNSKEDRRADERIQFTWKGALFTTITCGGIATFVLLPRNQRKKLNDENKIETIGKPLLGGSWCLVDQKGYIRKSDEFKGKYILLYFGFTFCPDICPQELEKMIDVINIIDNKYGQVVQPIFITVDPARDTVAQMEAYCREFHPRLIGLTGTIRQIKDITRKYRVYFNSGVKTTDDDYLVDHSIIQYLIAPNGQFLDFFGKNMTTNEIVKKVENYIQKDELAKKKNCESKGIIKEVQ